MLTAIQLRLKDNVYFAGLFFLSVSFIIFLVPIFSSHTLEENSGAFMLNFGLVAVYFVILWGNGRFKKGRRSLHTTFIFLLLFLISAYSLNRELPIFEDSVNWFCILLVLSSCNYLAFSFLSIIPIWGKHLMTGILGISTLVFVYLSLYLLPYYPVSAFAFFALGISLHTFVPLLLVICSVVLLKKITLHYRSLLKSFFAGVAFVFIALVVFVTKWNTLTHIINKEYRGEVIDGDKSLPAWVRVSQKIPKGWLTEKILKTDIVYSLSSGEGSLFRIPTRNFGEQQKHDPVVIISSLFTERVQLSEDEKIKVLKSLYDSRHEAQERLWSGENLVTSHINTNINLWPEYRMAYTEKVVTVTNNSNARWRSQEEAIYTFYLPEGGVVTSLSLWIDGKEAKGILTSTEKASQAYNTIVGTERRDPSVVHWQEGYTVSVRVFPVVSHESRMFKIGITSPLHLNDNRLLYNNIYFDGPTTVLTNEDIKLSGNNIGDIDLPDNFSTKNGTVYLKEGKYDPDWKLSTTNIPVSRHSFKFDGYSYSVAPYKVERLKTEIEDVYLDINAAWSERELKNIYDLVKGRDVYVYDTSMQKVSEGNYKGIFERLQKKKFSLFPFYALKKPSHSLVVTKAEGTSPNLADLKNCDFYNHLHASSLKSAKLFNFGYELSPYLKSLKELRWFQYEQGGLKDLKKIVANEVFASSLENGEQVVLHNAAIVLKKTLVTKDQSTAPDHLMRLFSYNHLMKEIGRNDTDTVARQQLIEEAQRAYIVSPVSSLIVLETVEDYERFDIKDGKNSLLNATAKSTGAVPEPHEWVLIILALIMSLCVKYPILFKRLMSRQ